MSSIPLRGCRARDHMNVSLEPQTTRGHEIIRGLDQED
jgi:hypothetical protein